MIDEKTEPSADPPRPPNRPWAEIVLIALILAVLAYRFLRKEGTEAPKPAPPPAFTAVSTPAQEPAAKAEPAQKETRKETKKKEPQPPPSLEPLRAEFQKFTPSSLRRIREALLAELESRGDREDLSAMAIETLAYLGAREKNPAWIAQAEGIFEAQKKHRKGAPRYRRADEFLSWADGRPVKFKKPDGAVEQWLAASGTYREGQEEKSIGMLKGVYSKNPGFFPAGESLARVYVERSQYSQAEPILRHLLGLEPGDAALEAMLAEALEGQGKWGEIISRYQPAASKDPGRWDLKLLLSQAYRRTGKFKEADRELKDLVAAQESGRLSLPKKREAVYYQERGKLAFDQEQYAQSLSHFERAYELDASSSSILKYLAGAQFRLKKYPEAVATYEKAAKTDPNDISTRLYHGMALFEAGRDARSEEVFTDVLKRGKETATGYYYLARIRERQGRTPDAVEMCRRALKVEPENKPAKALLAKLTPN